MVAMLSSLGDVPPEIAFCFATGNTARMRDLDCGIIEVGKAADIAAFDLSGPGYSEAPDPETLLVYSGSGRDLRHLWVSGEQLVNDRALTRRPYATIRREYSATYRDFWDRVAAAKQSNNTKVA